MPEIETIEPEAPDPVIEILAGAIDVLIERGWCQGHGADERGGYCIYGALAIAADHGDASSRALVSAKLALHGTLEADGRDPSIIKFNDEPGRTRAGVIALLREAIRRRRSCDLSRSIRTP